MDQPVTPSPNDIAIIGMALRVPGANSVDAFWHNLQNGVEVIREFTNDEMLAAGANPDLLKQPAYVKAGFVLDDIDQFDARFFNYTPREAELIDPQQRLFLECAWEALEHAGYAANTDQGRIGIFAGAGTNGYLLYNIMTNPLTLRATDMYQIMLSNDKDFLATRVSFKLNLKGPSVSLNVGCSTSLVAIHMARQSLLSYESDICLAGGVSIDIMPRSGYLYQEGGIASSDGHCRAFDASADGTASSSGVGIVVLKRLQDALDDRDMIYAVLKGSAINNDGSLKVGFTAPSVDGQAEVIALAQAVAEVMPENITYVETHGTATKLGDPIEVAALTQAFRAYTDRTQYCAIGSLKTNVGHLDTAAGVAGFIKTVLALYHRQIPPSLNFTQPNPHIDFATSPFFVNTCLRPWDGSHGPRQAGVSSFGIGGTNAHAILEEAPTLPQSGPSHGWRALTLSAQTATALDTATANLVAYLKQNRDGNFTDITYTLNIGRKAFSYRRSIVARSIEEAIAGLEDEASTTVVRSGIHDGSRPAIVFMFPGQGTQYVDMAAGLYSHEPIFREYIDRCAKLLQLYMRIDIRDALYPSNNTKGNNSAFLDQTQITQPAIFIIGYALAQLWISWGIQPTRMIGHSVGEYVAACLAGTISLEDALKLVALRGRLVQSMPGGSMLAIPLPEAEVRAMLDDDIAVAAVNGPALCTISGPHAAIERIEHALRERGLTATQLHTSHAFHSSMMDPILDSFLAAVKDIRLQPPNIPFISGVTGTWITAEQATDPAYWSNHLRQPVRFAEGISVLVQEKDALFLEVGPGRTLSTFALQQPTVNRKKIFNSLRHPQDQTSDEAFLLDRLGQVWIAGGTVDWPAVYQGKKYQRLPLPTYPFERQGYWIARGTQASGDASLLIANTQETLHARPELAEEIVAPRDDIERQLAAIWQSLLGFETIGIYDDFFELGGHSLLLTQMVSRLCHEFQVHISLAEVFEHRSIASMAVLIAQAQAELVDSDTLAALLDELEEVPDNTGGQMMNYT